MLASEYPLFSRKAWLPEELSMTSLLGTLKTTY
jgi:hypothetical protein